MIEDALHNTNLNLLTESLNKILVHDAIRSRKESQYVRDEVTFGVLQLIPVADIF